MPAAAVKPTRKRGSVRLRLSDTAKKLGGRFCDQLLAEGVTFRDAWLLTRAILCRQAMVRSEFEQSRSAELLGMDRSHFGEVYRSTTYPLFPEDEESIVKSIQARLRARRKVV